MQYEIPLEFASQFNDASARREEDKSRFGLGFFLFLLVNAVLFIRPSELWVSLEGLPIYNVVIVSCILASLPILVRQLSWSDLKRNPMTLCVVGFLGAAVLSHLCRFNFWMSRATFEEFYKTILYYLLFVGLVNSTKRLGVFCVWLVACIVIIAGLCVLQYHDVFHLPGISFHERVSGTDPQTGEALSVPQLYGPGMFNDPNDLSLILVATILISIHRSFETTSILRFIWLAPLPLVGYAFALTNSRGGFLSLLAGSLTLIVARFGWRKSVPLTLLALPVMLFLFAGRQTNINLNGDDTAAGRMDLWKAGFMEMKTSPIFGTGYGTYEEFAGQVAHNSFVHSFVETGLVGGTLFASAIFLPIILLRRRTAISAASVDERLASWRPCILALVTAYAVGLCSLTKCYTVSTYVIIGMGGAYWRLLWMECPEITPVMDKKQVKRLIKVSACTLITFYAMARFLA